MKWYARKPLQHFERRLEFPLKKVYSNIGQAQLLMFSFKACLIDTSPQMYVNGNGVSNQSLQKKSIKPSTNGLKKSCGS